MIWLNVFLLSNPLTYFVLLGFSVVAFLYLHFRKQANVIKMGFGIVTVILVIHLIVFWITMAPKDPL